MHKKETAHSDDRDLNQYVHVQQVKLTQQDLWCNVDYHKIILTGPLFSFKIKFWRRQESSGLND